MQAPLGAIGGVAADLELGDAGANVLEVLRAQHIDAVGDLVDWSEEVRSQGTARSAREV